jgi:hypothetical protein
LGPKIKNKEAKELEVTLFQRIEEMYRDSCLKVK